MVCHEKSCLAIREYATDTHGWGEGSHEAHPSRLAVAAPVLLAPWYDRAAAGLENPVETFTG